VAAGGTIDCIISGATNTLFKSLKSAGLYDNISVLYPILGGTSASTAINSLNPGTFNITWAGGITFTSQSVQSNGINGFGDTGWVESVDGGGGYTGLGAYTMNNPSNSNSQYDMGARSISPNERNSYMNIKGNSGEMRGRIQADLSGDFSASNPSTSGFNFLQRKDAGDVSGYANGSLLGSVVDAIYGSTNLSMYVMRARGVGGNPTTRQYNWFMISNVPFTNGEVSTLNTIITTFNTTLGRL
jgi:hypothetical protein